MGSNHTKTTQFIYYENYQLIPQSRRQAAIEGFRNGSIKILVATDIASRGIDILRISHVINYDMPGSTDDYIHRIGRTGRVEKNGDALTFVTKADAGKIIDLERIMNKPLERLTLEGFDYTKPAPDNGTSLSRQPRRRVVRKKEIRKHTVGK